MGDADSLEATQKVQDFVSCRQAALALLRRATDISPRSGLNGPFALADNISNEFRRDTVAQGTHYHTGRRSQRLALDLAHDPNEKCFSMIGGIYVHAWVCANYTQGHDFLLHCFRPFAVLTQSEMNLHAELDTYGEVPYITGVGPLWYCGQCL